MPVLVSRDVSRDVLVFGVRLVDVLHQPAELAVLVQAGNAGALGRAENGREGDDATLAGEERGEGVQCEDLKGGGGEGERAGCQGRGGAGRHSRGGGGRQDEG